MSWIAILRVLSIAAFGILSREAAAQQAVQSLPPYRPPSIVLAQPVSAAGSLATVPADQPVVVFRFGIGEAGDPFDPSSLRVWVDGNDRSSLFRIESRSDGGDAWGRLVPGAGSLQSGTHVVSARICTLRGLCATSYAVIAAVSAAASSAIQAAVRAGNQVPALIDLLDSARKLVRP